MWPFKQDIDFNKVPYTTTFSVGETLHGFWKLNKMLLHVYIIDIIDDDIMIVKILTTPNPFLDTWRRKLN